ncbi:hypothetical protein [Parasphingorhabdus sp.]|uniref:hypothetical protein n=1 Tax=Parasphingorhabdus sp. TaxID=2709688 RepID=UPI003002F86B
MDRDTPFSIDQTPVVNTINYQTDQLVSWLQAIAKNTGVSLGTSGGGGGGTSEPFNRNVVNF